MAIFSIPLPTEPITRQRTAFEGREYVMRYTYNERSDRWTLDLYDQNESLIVSGIKLVVGPDMFASVSDSRCPPGVLTLITNDELDPGFDLSSAALLYFDAAEVDS